MRNKKHIGMLGMADENSEYILPTVHSDFITEQEAKYILQTSRNRFKDSETVAGLDTNVRKSQTCWIDKKDEVIKKIIMKVCSMENLPFENAENVQVVKYEPNGFYNSHHDSTSEDNENSVNFLKTGGHRIVTMLIYLTDNFEGGATRFTNLDIDVKPPKYSGILFYPLDKEEKQCHPKAEHGGLPVSSGEKYIANIWIRQEKYIE